MALKRKTTKKKPKLLQFILVLILAVSTNADPQPEPEPVPDPEAKAEPEPQYGGRLISNNPMAGQGIRPEYPEQSTCGLASSCCGMQEQCYGYSECNQPRPPMPQPMPEPYPPQPMPRPPMPAPEPRCYPQWKWECSGKQDDRIRTVMKVKKHCKTIRAKDCRIVPDVIEREFKTERCFPKPLRQVFTYQRKVCSLTPERKTKTETWMNDKLHKVGSDIRNHCVEVKTYNCEDITKKVNRTKQIPVQKETPYTYPQCKIVRVPGGFKPGMSQKVKRTRYRVQCFDMPAEPSCTQAPCNLGGSCGPGQSACALNEFNFTSTCPYSQRQPMNIDYNNRGKREAQMYGDRPNWGVDPLGPGGVQPIQPLGPGGIQPIGPRPPIQPIAPLGPGGIQRFGPRPPFDPLLPLGPGGVQPIAPLGPGGVQPPCATIRQPVCERGSGGACLAGMQQCCNQQSSTRRVCKRVPYTVEEDVFMPGRRVRDQFKRECNNITITRTTTQYREEVVEEEFISKKCDPDTKTVCHNLTIPKYEVTREPKEGMITFIVNSCRPRTVVQRYVHTFPDGDVECRPESVRRKYRINKIVCDQEGDREYCFPIPYTEMDKVPGGPLCKWVQKQVCQDAPAPIPEPSCKQNPQCVQCDTFRRNNGFAGCGTSQCNQFIPGGMWGDGGYFGNGTETNDGGIFPIDDGSMGGDGGFYPGNGGGYFPGNGGGGGQGGFFERTGSKIDNWIDGGRDPYGPPRPDFNSYLTEDNLMNNVESLVDNELEDKMDSPIDQ